MKILAKYFFDVNIFNLIYSILIGVLFWEIIYIPLVFSTIGTLIGIFGYNYYNKNEYYFYYNKGYSKKILFLSLWITNIIIGTMIFFSIKLSSL
jgi:hypothetical protein